MPKFRGFQKYAYKKQKPGYYLHDFLNSKNPLDLFRNKRFILGIVALGLIIGGVVLTQGPLFHSYQETISAISDPNTRIWDVNGASQNLGEFNSIMFSSSIDTCSGCLVFRGTPNSTETAVALTKNPVGDLSIAHAKQLYLSWMWDTFGTCCGNQQAFGMYLTSNSTLPTQHNYNPLNDPQVAMAVTEQISSGSTFQQAVYIQKRIGETMTAESLDCTNTGSACFLSSSWQTTFGTGNSYESTQLYLNYTGNTGQSGCNQGGQGVGGQGCDVHLETELQKSNNSTALSVLFGISKAPPFPLTSGVYYAGFYVIFGYPGSIEYFYSAGKIPTQSVTLSNGFTLFMCTSTHIDEALPIASAPVSPSPTIDTGGFFGPVIRALIAIGVFILANIISFGNYLGGLMGPVWAFFGSLAAIVLNGISSIIITLLNNLGSLIGDPNLGNQLVSVFTQIGSYITALFSRINSLVSTLITFLVNSFNFLFDVTDGFLTYWIGTVLFGILGVLVTISNIIVTVLRVFQVGFPFVVLADLLWLLSESIDHGTEGAMKWWQPHEILVVNVGKLMFVLVETLSTFIYQTIVEIEGGAADIKPEIAGFSP